MKTWKTMTEIDRSSYFQYLDFTSSDVCAFVFMARRKLTSNIVIFGQHAVLLAPNQDHACFPVGHDFYNISSCLKKSVGY